MKRNRRGFLELAAGVPAGLAIAGLPLAGGAATATDAAAAPGAATAGATTLKIGVVGSGKVGGTLGGVWAQAGHEVMFSSRHIEHDRALAAKLGPNARAGTPREAAAFGEVVLIAVPYRALPQVGKELGDLIHGKPVIDACNPFVERDGEIASWARDKGVGLASAELLRGARIVRAFNAVGYVRMGSMHREPGRIGMPIAGDDEQAIALVSRLVREIGFEPVLVGGLATGRHLIPGTPLAGEHTPEEIRRIAATLE